MTPHLHVVPTRGAHNSEAATPPTAGELRRRVVELAAAIAVQAHQLRQLSALLDDTYAALDRIPHNTPMEF
jgi:hypothetical protein